MKSKEILQRVLDEKRISVGKLATKTMVSANILYNIKYGKTNAMNMDVVKAITKLYPDINENFLLGLSDQMYKDKPAIETTLSFDMQEFRNINKLTQGDAAEYFGCKQSFLSYIENGKAKTPDSYIEKIKADGIYRLPEDNDKVEPAQSEPPKQDVLKYIAALEALLEYKDKEIEQLKDLLDQLQHSLKQ